MNWHSSSWPAGGTVNQQQQQQNKLLFILLSESGAVISSLEKYYLFARIKGSVVLLFVSLTEHLTCNFSLEVISRLEALFLHLFFSFIFIAFYSIKGLILKCLGVKACFSATHTCGQIPAHLQILWPLCTCRWSPHLISWLRSPRI